MTAPQHIARLLANPATRISARVALTSPFWCSGLLKLHDWNGALAEMRHFALAPAAPFAATVITVQLAGSAALIAGRLTWLAAGALGSFTAIATLIAHAFWTVSATERIAQFNTFLDHLAIIGGLVLAAALGESGQKR